MSKLLLSFYLTWALMSAWPVDGAEWREKINRDGILIEQQHRHPNDNQWLTKGQMTLQAKPAAVLALLQDLSACEQWLYGCQSATRLPDGMVHMVFEGPLWFKDRYVVFLSESHHDPHTGVWHITVTNQPDSVTDDQAVRIEQAAASWTLKPTGSDQLEITYELYMDPKISLRSGVNKYNRDAMFRSLKALRELVQSPPYATAQLPDTSD